MTDVAEDDRDVPRKGPDAFRTISEVAEELGLPQHVLRFWETRFPQIRPIKRGGGRRYYRPADVELLRGVKRLLYGEGYTIRGVQRILREQGGRKLAQEAGARPADDEDAVEPRIEPGLALAAQGPEIWAPNRRAAPATLGLFGDPDEAEGGHGCEDDAAAAAPPAPRPQASERRPALTGDQIGRLSRALDELAACRRLLDERS